MVLVLLPTSCCSWMRVANCCRSATSLPWACLMKGCSRRWVTDGRASKSFIRHLTATKTLQTQKKNASSSQRELNRNDVESPEHLRNLVFWISSNSREPAGVLKSGSLICCSASENLIVTITMAPSANKVCYGTAVSPIGGVQCLPVGDVICACGLRLQSSISYLSLQTVAKC